MVVVGFIVGFHVHTNALALLGAIAFLMLFGFAMSWVMATIGLYTRNAEAAQGRRLPGPGRAGVRVERIRAYGQHAGPAAGLRQPPTGVRQRQRRTVAGAGRSHPLQGAGGRGLVRRHHRRVRPAGGGPLPADGLGGAPRGRPPAGRVVAVVASPWPWPWRLPGCQAGPRARSADDGSRGAQAEMRAQRRALRRRIPWPVPADLRPV